MKIFPGNSSDKFNGNEAGNKSKFQSELNPTYHGIQELLNNEEALRNYNNHTVKLISDCLHHKTASNEILEFGAGTGTLALIFRDRYKAQVDCIEIDPTLKEFLNQRNLKTYSEVREVKQKYQSIYSSNVLEHIENDEEFIALLADRLETGGYLALYVPAFPILFSDLDRRVGHVRRYRRNELISKISNAGLEIKYCKYSDSLGFFASIALRIFGFNTKSGLGSILALKFYDKIIFPISLLFDLLGLSHVMGKNIILSARKP